MLNGRGNLFKLKHKNITIVDESYNSNPLSLRYAINNFNNLKVNHKYKNILLGDMLELGRSSQLLHNRAISQLNTSKAQKIYVFGKYMAKAFNKIKTQKKGKVLNTKKDVIDTPVKDAAEIGDPAEVIALKGANTKFLSNFFLMYDPDDEQLTVVEQQASGFTCIVTGGTGDVNFNYQEIESMLMWWDIP